MLTEKIYENEQGGESRYRILFFNEGDLELLSIYELEYLEYGLSIATIHF